MMEAAILLQELLFVSLRLPGIKGYSSLVRLASCPTRMVNLILYSRGNQYELRLHTFAVTAA
uniref:Phosphatidylinositol:ceramide inositolphosphotransferase 1 n=1 Tax=Rhizophora mucronata TaxID=61149 RepID=A0A2P2M429_RHIMU